MRVAFGLGLVLTVMTVGTAGAQVTAEQQSAIRANCRSDFMSKCSGVTPGGKEALQCLQKNVAALSAGCKTAVSATLPEPAPAAAVSAPAKPAAAPKVEAAAPPAAAPAAPVTATPAAAPSPPATANVAPKPAEAAKPRTAARPPSKPQPVSPPTAQTAAAPPASANPPAAATAPTTAPDKPVANAAVALRACKLDLVRHCSNVAFGDGRKLACLNERADNLTVRCRTALKVSAPIR